MTTGRIGLEVIINIQTSVMIFVLCFPKAGISHSQILNMKLTDKGFPMQSLGRIEIYLSPLNIAIVFIISPFLKECFFRFEING